MHNPSQLNNALRAAYFIPDNLKENSAWLGHLPFAAWIMHVLRPKVFVELGSHWGHSYFAFCKAAKESEVVVRCYAVDTWKGDEHANHYGDEVFEFVNNHNNLNYGSFSRLLRLKFDDALINFGDYSVDLLHIDGFHTYEAVKHDFESWLPKMAQGGIVLFHDINVRERGFGVWKLWDELKAVYPEYIEFSHSHGLGVIRLPGMKNKNPDLNWLFDIKNQVVVRDYFAALGAQSLSRHNFQITLQDIKNLTETLVSRDQKIVDYHNLVALRDQQIQEFKNVVEVRDQQIQEFKNVVEVRDQQIQEFKNVVEVRDQQIQEFKNVVEVRDQQIQEFKNVVEVRDQQIQEFKNVVEVRDQQIQEFKNVVEVRDQQIQEFKNVVEVRDQQIQELKNLNQQLLIVNHEREERLKIIESLWYVKIRKMIQGKIKMEGSNG